MKTKSERFFWASDYGGYENGTLNFYYGYEYQSIVGLDVADDDEETETWGFVVYDDAFRPNDPKRIVFRADAKELGGDKWGVVEMFSRGLMELVKSGVRIPGFTATPGHGTETAESKED